MSLAAPAPWDQVAGGYADDVMPMFVPYARDALALAGVAPPAPILDVACGPGTLALLAADAGHEVVALDFAPEMVARLRAAAEARGLAVDARVGDGQALPLDDGRFAAAFSLFGLMFFPDRARGFAELRRVLRPGGVAVVSSWVPAAQVPLLAASFAAAGAAAPDAAAGPPPGPPPLSSPELCRAEMSAAGFADVEVVVRTHARTFPSTEAFWDWQRRTSAPLSLVRGRVGEARWPEVERAILASLRERFGDGPQELVMPALLTLGRRPADGR